MTSVITTIGHMFSVFPSATIHIEKRHYALGPILHDLFSLMAIGVSISLGTQGVLFLLSS